MLEEIEMLCRSNKIRNHSHDKQAADGREE
jgi:hypothetical protein